VAVALGAWLLAAPSWAAEGPAAAANAQAAAPPAAAPPQAAPAAVQAPAPIEAVVLPTRVEIGGAPMPPALKRTVAKLDALLTDTAQDLGLVVDLSAPPSARQGADELGLVEAAQRSDKVAILPILRLETEPTAEPLLELRIVAAAPAQRTLRSRVERVPPDKLAVRAVVMLRDVVAELALVQVDRPRARPAVDLAEPVHSMGRAILATNATLYGGYLGYSLQRASGSDDPRLLYPLIAVGAGAGLGAAIIVADEWDVGVGDAWYLAAGVWWPAVASHLIFEGRFGDVESMGDDDAWSFGVVGSTVGLGLASVGLLNRGMGDGGAALAHSGGGIGLLVGGLCEIAHTGTAEEVPLGGFGYGAAAGWVIASATAIVYHPPATNVLAIDLGLVLGGLGGAAAASPLLFDAPTAGETRGWVGATGAGMIGGGTLAWYLSHDEPEGEPHGESEPQGALGSDPRGLVHRWGVPMPTALGAARLSGEQARSGLGPEALPPAMGVSWRSELW